MSDERLVDILVELRKECAANEEKIRRSLDLSEAEYNGLLCLNKGEKITCQEFSKRMNLSVSRGSRVIDKLFEKGYLDRVDCSEDRRCKHVKLTMSGMGTRHKIDKHRRECEQKLAADYSERKLDMLKKELRRLIIKF
ncbi:MAG: MarR family transcriptional regulator [Candidatus Aminicenantaceae bacterium]